MFVCCTWLSTEKHVHFTTPYHVSFSDTWHCGYQSFYKKNALNVLKILTPFFVSTYCSVINLVAAPEQILELLHNYSNDWRFETANLSQLSDSHVWEYKITWLSIVKTCNVNCYNVFFFYRSSGLTVCYSNDIKLFCFRFCFHLF